MKRWVLESTFDGMRDTTPFINKSDAEDHISEMTKIYESNPEKYENVDYSFELSEANYQKPSDYAMYLNHISNMM